MNSESFKRTCLLNGAEGTSCSLQGAPPAEGMCQSLPGGPEQPHTRLGGTWISAGWKLIDPNAPSTWKKRGLSHLLSLVLTKITSLRTLLETQAPSDTQTQKPRHWPVSVGKASVHGASAYSTP